jgi:type II secretory pathway predicted ATPase ExeA
MKDRIKTHFGFVRFPFEKDIPIKDLFRSLDFEEALARLTAALDGEDIVLLWGRAGCGKSTVVRAFYHDGIDENRHLKAYVPVPSEPTRPGHLYKAILEEFAIQAPYNASAAASLLKKTILQANTQKNRKPVIVLDEAQHMTDVTLSALKNLVNFEHDSKNLALIVLAGQEELPRRLAYDQFLAIKQRIRIVARMNPLGPDETRAYVRHHIKIAGAKSKIFTDEAITEVHNLAEGIPRTINAVCFRALFYAASKTSEYVEPAMVRDAWNVDEEPPPRTT